MKKNYETPAVEVVEFNYRDQVVAASMPCGIQSINVKDSTGACSDPVDHKYYD